jgi:hypothetical protein
MQRTSPVFQNRWNGERRIQAVNMPVEWTNAARNDGSHICGGFLTPMADYCLSLIALLEEVWHLFIAILSLCRLESSNLFVLAVGTSPDALKAGLQFLGEAEGTRNALLQVGKRNSKDTLERRHSRWVFLIQALIAEPLIREMV